MSLDDKIKLQNCISDRLETLSIRFNLEYNVLFHQYVTRYNNLNRVNPFKNVDNKLMAKAYQGVIKYCEDRVR